MKEGITTIKVTQETKKRLMSLDLSEKNKTFDIMINELTTHYQKHQKNYKKDHQDWKKAFEKSQKEWTTYQGRKTTWKKDQEQLTKLFRWAKSKGFKS